MTTCMETSNNFSYMMLNLMGEVGEFAGKVAKAIRKGKVKISGNQLWLRNLDYENTMTAEEIDGLRKEAGDMLWQLSGLCTVMGWSLDDIATENLAKLASRKQRNQIDGSGDNR